MAPMTPLAEPPHAAATLPATSLGAEGEVLLDVRWRVYSPATGAEEIASTVLAGATLECGPLAEGVFEPETVLNRRSLTLTFWREAPQGRARLAVYCSTPRVKFASAPGTPAQAAVFQLAVHRAAWSVDVTAQRSILRFTHFECAGASGPGITCCRSILPELLGLRGGQYRLAEVHVGRAARLGRVAPRAETRQAV